VTMTAERCFEIWAPDQVGWSAWAKPVLFSQLRDSSTEPHAVTAFSRPLPRFSSGTALIVDLNGTEAINAGVELAREGWRPVPLFNATNGPKPLVNVLPLMGALLAGADVLEGLSIRPDAPPAFLLDARRMEGNAKVGVYDNRSVVLPQDFPSATMLATRGIREIVVIQRSQDTPQRDLCHVLLRWQQAGIELRQQKASGEMRDLVVSPPSWFRKTWYRIVALSGLRRSNVGGFGAVVPEESSGGYG
jgi:hypothetical protein